MPDKSDKPDKKPVKKGDFVRLVRDKFENSVEAKASDVRLSNYVFDTKGEILDVREDYGLVKFGRVPTPNVWLKLEQLEKFE
ncbi:MAG: NAD(P)H-quinone oxidoreductase subunit O [Cyanobacteria bacterium J06634_6]